MREQAKVQSATKRRKKYRSKEEITHIFMIKYDTAVTKNKTPPQQTHRHTFEDAEK